MRQRHYAGEKLFVDYAGATVPIYDSTCEEAYRAAIFVGALGASGYAYAEATRTASLPDWLGSHVRMLTFYGHAPTILVPDNPRVGVTKADRYEPELQRSYEEMAAHYSIAVIPARPYRPKDKAIVEGLVKILCRYIRFRFRRSRFTSIAEINRALMVCVERINDQRHRRFGVSRRERFEALEKAALKALPTTEYDGGEWKDAKLHPDCFLAVEVDYYSAPHIHRHKTLRIKLTEHQVEIFLDLERLANHGRAAGRKSASTATTLGSEPAGRAARSVWLSV
jgi:hypothetical protein